MLPQDSDPGRGWPHPVRRADPHPEGEEEESVHLLPPKRVHILREREAACPVPIGHGPSEGLRRRLERARPDEAVEPPGESDSPLRENLGGPGGTVVSSIASENPVVAIHRLRRNRA